MDDQVKTEKTEIPYSIKRGISKLWQLEMDIRELRTLQTSLGHGMFGDDEKDIEHLRYIANQFALESIERICRETCEAVKGRYNSQNSDF
jgi:hypothetical protein